MKTIIAFLTLLPLSTFAEQSTCYGTTANGVQLPADGENFEGYSTVGRIAGRTYVHSSVKDIILSAYQALEKDHAEKIYKYAETGFKEGGEFKPHKTHRNGLSVDFMTPVINEKGESVHLPTHALNKYGYNIEFDKKDVYENLSIDYEAMAAHIVALHISARERGYELWRVIFDPQLQSRLFETKYAAYLKQYITFSKKASWVRHDEHYHIDFSIPSKPIKSNS